MPLNSTRYHQHYEELDVVFGDEARRARERFAYAVSEKAARDELRVQRMLGAEWIDAYLNAWKIADEVAELVYAEDRPAVHLPCRYVRNPR